MAKSRRYLSRANVKLRGKKFKMLPCGCCTAENLKDECRDKEALKEIHLFKTQP